MRISDWSSDVCSSDLVCVLHQGDEGRAVRIVLQPLDRADHVELTALEVDLAVEPLGAATAETHRDTAAAATPAGLGDRKRVVEGKSGSGRVGYGCRRIIKKKKYNSPDNDRSKE